MFEPSKNLQYGVACLIVLSCEAMDEDHLPFKSMWALMFRSGLRLHVEAESLHNLWNTVKLGAKRAGLQGALLLGTLMANVNHGPYNSGQNLLSRQRAAASLSETIPLAEFQELQSAMRADMTGVEGIEVPHSADDMPNLQNVNVLGPYVPSSASTTVALQRFDPQIALS